MDNLDPNREPILELLSPNAKWSWFGILKTHIWNFLLPPHIRLGTPKKEDRNG